MRAKARHSWTNESGEDCLWRNTSQGPVTQRVVQFAVFLELSETTPSVAKDQDTWQVISSSRGTTVVNIHLASCRDQPLGM